MLLHELVDCIQSAAGTFAAQDQHIFRGRNDDLIIVQRLQVNSGKQLLCFL